MSVLRLAEGILDACVETVREADVGIGTGRAATVLIPAVSGRVSGAGPDARVRVVAVATDLDVARPLRAYAAAGVAEAIRIVVGEPGGRETFVRGAAAVVVDPVAEL